MKRRYHWLLYVFAALVCIGIWQEFQYDPIGFLIPVAIFGAVFLLLKFPPSRGKRAGKPYRPSAGASAPRNKSVKDKRKHIPFKVIQGSKRDDKNDSEQQYPYH